jgi:CheY-specific phosphatase CheX
MMGRMLGEKYTEINADIESGATEFVNIVYGAAKEFFGKEGVVLERALPRIERDGQFVKAAAGARNALHVSFTSDAGPFALSLAFAP